MANVPGPACKRSSCWRSPLVTWKKATTSAAVALIGSPFNFTMPSLPCCAPSTLSHSALLAFCSRRAGRQSEGAVRVVQAAQ